MAKAETIFRQNTSRNVLLRLLKSNKDNQIYLLIAKGSNKVFFNRREIMELREFLDKIKEKHGEKKEDNSVLWERLYQLEEEVDWIKSKLQDFENGFNFVLSRLKNIRE